MGHSYSFHSFPLFLLYGGWISAKRTLYEASWENLIFCMECIRMNKDCSFVFFPSLNVKPLLFTSVNANTSVTVKTP